MDSVRRSKRWGAVLSLLVIVVMVASSFLVLVGSTTAQATIIDATPYLNAAKPDYGIQAALDAAAAQGGATVQLPAGTYPLETYLQLKNGVTLQGTGATTILKAGRNESRVFITQTYTSSASSTLKVSDTTPFYAGQVVYIWRSVALKDAAPSAYTVASVSAVNSTITLDRSVNYPLKANISQVSYGLYTKLTVNAVKGTKTIKVADTSVFNVGEGVAIQYGNAGIGNWGVEMNIVATIDSATKTIMLKNNLSLNVPTGTAVAHGYGGILALGDMPGNVRVTDIGVKDLVIEGWNTPIKPAFNEFFLGGINFVMCDRATVSNVIIRYWHTDAFSFQKCDNTTVSDSTALENRGHGFHPGTASHSIEFLRIHAINNYGYPGIGTAGDGVYYCWNNSNVNIRQSEFRGNAGSGVGDVGGAIGGVSSTVDATLIIEDSVMENNGRAGINISGGGINANTIIRRNTVKNNNTANMSPDYAGISISADTSHAQKYTISNNWVESSSVPPTQFCGIRERNLGFTPDFNTIKDNVVLNHRDCAVTLIGANSVETGTQTTPPGTTPTVTLTAVPPTSTTTATVIPTAAATATALATATTPPAATATAIIQPTATAMATATIMPTGTSMPTATAISATAVGTATVPPMSTATATLPVLPTAMPSATAAVIATQVTSTQHAVFLPLVVR